MGGLFAMGIFTRHINGVGAITGVLASAVVLWWTNTYHANEVHVLFHGFIGIAACITAGYLSSIVLNAVAPSLRKPTQGLTIYSLQETMRRDNAAKG